VKQFVLNFDRLQKLGKATGYAHLKSFVFEAIDDKPGFFKIAYHSKFSIGLKSWDETFPKTKQISIEWFQKPAIDFFVERFGSFIKTYQVALSQLKEINPKYFKSLKPKERDVEAIRRLWAELKSEAHLPYIEASVGLKNPVDHYPANDLVGMVLKLNLNDLTEI